MSDVNRGADIERLRDLADVFGEKAELLRTEIIELLSSKNEESESYFKGPAADRFREEFREAKPTFQSFADALDAAKQAANTNADNIQAATD